MPYNVKRYLNADAAVLSSARYVSIEGVGVPDTADARVMKERKVEEIMMTSIEQDIYKNRKQRERERDSRSD